MRQDDASASVRSARMPDPGSASSRSRTANHGVAAAMRATPWFAVRERLEADHGSGILAERTDADASS